MFSQSNIRSTHNKRISTRSAFYLKIGRFIDFNNIQQTCNNISFVFIKVLNWLNLKCFPLQYLTKQVIALREVNDSRLRIYESLENSIQDLEHEKHRILVENNTDKKHIRK